MANDNPHFVAKVTTDTSAVEKGFSKLAEAARRAGVVVDEAFDFDAVTEKVEEAVSKMSFRNAEKELDKMKSKVSELDKTYTTNQRTINNLRTSLTSMTKTLKDYRSNLEHLQASNADPLRIGQAQRQVDEYEEKIKTMNAALDAAETEQKNLGGAILETNEFIEAYQRKLEGAEEKHTSLRQRIREVREALAQMRIEGKENTPEFAALQQEGAKLTDTLGDINSSVRAMARDEIVINAIVGSFQALSGAVSVASGIMAKFVDDENMMVEVQKDLQAVIAITTGLQSVQVALNKDGALISSIRIIQSKLLAKSMTTEAVATAAATAATTANTTATKGATIAQRLFNAAAKANPYVLLATAMIAAGSAIAIFASRAASARKAHELLLKVLEREEKILKRNQEFDKRQLNERKANGLSDKEVEEQEIENAETYLKKRQKLLNRYMKSSAFKKNARYKNGFWEFVGDDKDKVEQEYNHLLDEVENAESNLEDIRSEHRANTIKREREYQETLTKLSFAAEQERQKMLASFTRNKVKRIEEERDINIKAIEQEREEFIKAQKLINSDIAIDTSSFDKRIRTERIKATKELTEVYRQWNEQAKEMNRQTVAMGIDDENALMKQQAELVDDVNTRESLLAAVRKREHEERLRQLREERDEEIRKLKEESGVDENTQAGKALVDAIRGKYDAKESSENQSYNLNEYKAQIDRVKAAAEETIAIEQRKEERIMELRQRYASGDITKKDRDEGIAIAETSAKLDQQKLEEQLGMTEAEVRNLINSVATEVIGISLEQLDAMIVKAEEELALLEASGAADPKKIAEAKVRIGELKEAKDKLENGKNNDNFINSKVYKQKMATLRQLGDTITEVGNAIGGTAGKSISALGQVLNITLTTITSISETTRAASAAMEASATTAAASIGMVEKASVILAVISAAIQAATLIAGLFDGSDDQEAYERTMKVYKNYIDVLDEVIEKQLELAESASGEAAQNAYDKAIELTKKQAAAARQMGKEALQASRGNAHTWGYRQAESITSNAQAMREAKAVLGQYADIWNLVGKEAKIFDLPVETLIKLKTEAQYFYAQLRDETREFIDQIIAAEEAIGEIERKSLEQFSGTTFDAMVDDLKEALSEMSSDVKDFSKSIQDTLRDNILSSLIDKQFKGDLLKLQEKMSDFMQNKSLTDNNALTAREYEEIMNDAANLDEKMKAYREWVAKTYEGLIDETTTQEGTSKGFQAMSQDTADELNGRFTALQITGANIDEKMSGVLREAATLNESMMLSIGIANNILIETRGINANTAMIAETNSRLRNIEETIEKRL